MKEAEKLFYLDTSALLPYYRNESASVSVQQFLSSLTVPVILSSLVEVELESALARLVRMDELKEGHACRIEEAFNKDCKAGLFRRITLSDRHFDQARSWLQRRITALRTLDALHLACSHALKAELVTSDRIFANAADDLGVDCRLLVS